MTADFGRRRGRVRPRSQGDGRFRRGRRTREAFAGKLVQAITMTVLCGALFWLLATAVRLVRAHFDEAGGPQAWLLPLVIGAILVFLLYRLVRLWREVLELGRELKSSPKSMNDNDLD